MLNNHVANEISQMTCFEINFKKKNFKFKNNLYYFERPLKNKIFLRWENFQKSIITENAALLYCNKNVKKAKNVNISQKSHFF